MHDHYTLRNMCSFGHIVLRSNRFNVESNNINPNDADPKSIKDTWREIQVYAGMLLQQLGRFLYDITDIREGLDEQGTRDSIKKNIELKGSNIWLLISATMVASLGLNLNSPAVIIGAMLISPLMSPILGIGLSVGINDRDTLYQSMFHFGVAILVSLLTSTIYFALTPLSGDATPEILARTSPTLLDVFVAFFGGIAGIVSGTRLEKSNAIPGVAIATALLPPICASGFGLANGEWAIFLNSFYLFFINSVFIALATYLIVRFLGFRTKKYVNLQEKKRSRLVVFLFVLLTIVPSIFILMRVIREVRVQTNAKAFVAAHFESDDRNIDWECKRILKDNGKKTDSTLLKVSVFGDTISQGQLNQVQSALADYNLHRTKLKVIQINIPNFRDIKQQDQATFDKEIQNLKAALVQRDQKIESLQQELSTLQSGLQHLQHLQLLEPQLATVQYGEMAIADSTRTSLPTLSITWKPGTSAAYRRTHSQQIGQYLQAKMALDTLQILEQ